MTYDPRIAGNWLLSGRSSYAGSVPSGSFDISGCTRFRVEVDNYAAASGDILFRFGSDAGSNYSRVVSYTTGTTVGSATGITTTGMYAAHASHVHGFKTIEFSKIPKTGVVLYSNDSASQVLLNEGYKYTGVDAMDTLSIAAGSFVMYGTISVYKWVA